MASVHDVAAYILQKCGRMTAMKLQKLVYYAQAWSLVWDEHPIFEERIEAWANGPVAPDLYREHRGLFEVRDWPRGNPANLDQAAIDTIDAVIEFYGPKTAQWLSDLTHQEQPWQEARMGVPAGEWCDREISLASMHQYYSGLGRRN